MINLRDTGTEIGFACARVFALSTVTLVGTIAVSGVISIAGDFPLIEAPIHRVAKMSGGLMGLSVAGCFLGALMSEGICKNEKQKNGIVAKEFVSTTDAEISFLHREIRYRNQEIEEWEDWMKLCQSVPESYEVFGCKDCQHFVGSDNGGNFFVCAMHPYGKRNCEDKG